MNQEIIVRSVNISTEKGTIKTPVESIVLGMNGVEGDAHSGPWHRQVSLLGVESFQRFSKLAARELAFGEFAENITTDGLELITTNPLDKLIGENIKLEITQIGKECHGSSCAIFREVGNCVMPKEGIFARVIKGGTLKPGDRLTYRPRPFRIQVITLSDRAYAGTYEDKSGPAIIHTLEKHFENKTRILEIEHSIIPDNAENLEFLVGRAIDGGADVVFTTGGTGVGPRDITVDTIKPLLDKEIPGIMEMIRVKYGAEKPNALLSCGVAGIIGDTFAYTLPGSVKGVNEYMTEILKTMEHLIYMRHSLDAH